MRTADISVELIDYCGSDLSVVNAARVSFHKESNWELDSTPPDHKFGTPVLKIADDRLINYLAKHKHFSPFNHAFISVRVKAPIFVARQLVKHKFMPWNEVSRRYVDEEPEFYIPALRCKSDNVKQGSGGPHPRAEGWEEVIKDSSEKALRAYKLLLSDGVCQEQARVVLPQNVMTEWIWSGTLGAFASMLKLRLDTHTQYESRIVAELVYNNIKPLFPVSLTALLENE